MQTYATLIFCLLHHLPWVKKQKGCVLDPTLLGKVTGIVDAFFLFGIRAAQPLQGGYREGSPLFFSFYMVCYDVVTLDVM